MKRAHHDPVWHGLRPSWRAYAVLALFWIALAGLGILFMVAVGWMGTWGTP